MAREGSVKRPPGPEPFPAALRLYLLSGVFVTGAAVLALELVGSRVISPFYGSSLYCWAAIITVTMVALAAGYGLGGRAADRDPTPDLFPRLVAAAAVAVALIPLLRIPVLRHTAWMGVRLGALASSAVLLGPALACLGAVVPVVVRLLTREVSSVGSRAGEVMAVSTLGSVLGAVASGFFLIPNLPVPRILFGLAALLFLLCGVGLIIGRRRFPVKTAVAAVSAAVLGWWPGSHGMLFARQSLYGEVKVLDSNGRLYLLVDGVTQSVARRLGEGFEADSPYVHTLELAALLPHGGQVPGGAGSSPLAGGSLARGRPRPRALFIGSGAGQLPDSFEIRYGIDSDVVEIDPVMLEAARLFGFPRRRQGSPDPGRVFVEDGRTFMERIGRDARDAIGEGGRVRRYDIIVLDAFVGENPPYHLFTAESFQAARRLLEPDGVLAANLVSLVGAGQDDAWVTAYKTMRSVFKEVRVHLASPPHEGLANVVFFCSDGPLDGALARARARARAEVRRGSEYALSHELTPPPEALRAAVALNDDYAPVESLLAKTALAWRKVVQDTAGEAALR
ncbi:MAG: fused MFS/spermidine synthase [Elusimicrobia bacterium]|nr:fused MFS/spermidine synthase [Elusimicrobiota bacterium]